MIEIGRLCVKIAGRDAGLKCVVVDIIDDNFVLIDGETRRRKCNILHIEPLDKVLDIKKGASHEQVAKAFEAAGYGVFAPKTKPKKAARPRKARKSKLAGKTAAPKAAAKPAAAKAPANAAAPKAPAAAPANTAAVKAPAENKPAAKPSAPKPAVQKKLA
jgi:large subunit ribosomal protein L14e